MNDKVLISYKTKDFYFELHTFNVDYYTFCILDKNADYNKTMPLSLKIDKDFFIKRKEDIHLYNLDSREKLLKILWDYCNNIMFDFNF